MILLAIEAVLAVLLVLTILLQQRASGMTNAAGGMGGAQVQRRGAERAIYRATHLFGAAFFLLIIVDWFI